MLAFALVCQKYGNFINWLEYNSIQTIISKKLNPSAAEKGDSLYNKVKSSVKPAQYCYRLLQKQFDGIYIKYYQKFNRIVEVMDNEYLQAFANVSVTMTITKYRDFQYRLLVNDIHTNSRLFHWKITDSKICEICKKEVQTIIHLFVTCESAQKMWVKFQEYIKLNV